MSDREMEALDVIVASFHAMKARAEAAERKVARVGVVLDEQAKERHKQFSPDQRAYHEVSAHPIRAALNGDDDE